MNSDNVLEELKGWKEAPVAGMVHPREEHLIPFFMTAAAGEPNATPQLIFDVIADSGEHAICSGYLFR